MTKEKAVVDFDQFNDTVSLATHAAGKFQFKVAQGHLQVLLNLFPGTRPALRVYNNTLTSINEGLRDQALTRAGALVEIKLANTKLESDLKKAMDSLSQPSKFDPEKLYHDLSHESLKVYDKNMNEIQTKLNKTGMFTGYVPVLPLTQPPLNVDKLNRIGITADHFAGYTILKKQFVAGISRDQLIKMRPKTKPGVIYTENQKKQLDEDAVQTFRDIIERKYAHLKMTMMGEPTSWWEAVWLWYAPTSEFKALKSCTINEATVQSLKIKGWSFPFHKR